MKVYHPAVSVKLIKVINRRDLDKGQRAADRLAQVKTIDLAPYLSDMGGVYTTKSPSQPAGSFSIILADRLHTGKDQSDTLDSLYGLIEPMDLVEIRMARTPHVYGNTNTGEMPVIMRGFVSDVRREESIGQDGRPVRRVLVNGQDYGKILQILQIIYLNNSAVGDNIISGLPLLQKYQVDTSSDPPVAKFVGDIVSLILDKFVQNMPWADSTAARPFAKLTPVADAVQGRVSSTLVNQWPGGQAIYGLLAQVCDVASGFNELFSEDRPEDVAVVLRPTPFVGIDGRLLPSAAGGWYAPESTITDEDVVSFQVSRTDENVANLFWIRDPHFYLLSDAVRRLDSQLEPVTDNPNCDPNLYGLRMLDWTTSVGHPQPTIGQGAAAQTIDEQIGLSKKWLQSRLQVLKDGTVNSALFESGVMRIKGNENLRAGTFVNVIRQGITWRCYADSVTHEFIPFRSYQTTVRFSRGTGWIQRNRAGVDNPYWREMTADGALA